MAQFSSIPRQPGKRARLLVHQDVSEDNLACRATKKITSDMSEHQYYEFLTIEIFSAPAHRRIRRSRRFIMETGEGWVARLIPLRDELLRGDLRPLYLGWLAGVSAGDVDEDAIEAEVPPGMAQLSGVSSHRWAIFLFWRRGRESNPSKRLCRPFYL